MILSEERNLRIVFMGTPDFAVATLKVLVDAEYEVVGVITAADKPAGRGRKLHTSSVKKYAEEQGLRLMQPANLKHIDFLEELKSLKANLQIVVAFRMLPKVVWDLPKYGTFNLHASLLPHYRGAAPINWAIMNGETQTGVTTFFIDDKIDTGAIILQEKEKIGPDDTAGHLHDRLMVLGAQLVLKTVKLIERDSIVTTKQEQLQEYKSAYKIHKETCTVNWNDDIHIIHNHIRGLSPYPTAWTHLVNGDQEISLKIYRATMEIASHELKTGMVLFDKKEMRIVVKGGYVKLLEIQLPGKRKMGTSQLLNGVNLSKSAHVF